MVEFGFFSLTLGLCLSVYGLVMGALSTTKPVQGVILSARNAFVGVTVCVSIAALTLWTSLLTHDFSVRYAFRNSSVDMPPIYLLTSFWSALEGSHLLWTFIMSIMVSLALLTVRPRNQALMPGLLVAFGVPMTFMLLLNVWASAPLTRQFPVGQFGSGMNALLQNPYMAAHPPSLFSGYCSLIVPFAYGIAALIRGAFTPEWLVTVRRWTLAGWAILTIGIFLGGKWAYVELGWAGYWAWDPVENSSFMPWLASTAAIHTLLILDKTSRLPRLAVFLSAFAFILTFLGTFITRSGVISSVHSFAESNIGPAYLTYIVLLLSGVLVLLATRGHLLQGASKTSNWTLSKESSLLFTNFFLLFLLALVLVGTLLPLIVEATRGVKISIQQPFFNAFAPWIGLGLVSLIGIGNLMRWRNGKIDDPVASLLFPAIWAVCLTASLVVVKKLDAKSTVGFALALWSAGVLVMDLVNRLKLLRWNGNVFLKFNRPYLGAWVVHMGFLIAICGFLGSYRGVEAQTTLNKNESTQFYGYTLTNKGLNYERAYNYQLVTADIHAVDSNGIETVIQPVRSKYTNKDEWMNEIGVHSNFWHDVYLVLSFFDPKNEQIMLKMHINPTVKFVWTSLVVMVIGTLIGLTHRIRKRSVDVNPDGLEQESITMSIESLIQDTLDLEHIKQPKAGYATSALIVIFAVGVSLFGFSPYAWAQGEAQPSTAAQSAAPVIELNPMLKDVGQELRCPTCQGVSILESDTPQSVAMRAEIERQLSQGKGKQEILEYFQQRYGEWILRRPDSGTAMGFWIWAIPSVGLIIGPAALIFGMKRSRKRELQEREDVIRELKNYLQSAPVEVQK